MICSVRFSHPRSLIKILILMSHSWRLWFSRSGPGPRILHFYKFPRLLFCTQMSENTEKPLTFWSIYLMTRPTETQCYEQTEKKQKSLRWKGKSAFLMPRSLRCKQGFFSLGGTELLHMLPTPAPPLASLHSAGVCSVFLHPTCISETGSQFLWNFYFFICMLLFQINKHICQSHLLLHCRMRDNFPGWAEHGASIEQFHFFMSYGALLLAQNLQPGQGSLTWVSNSQPHPPSCSVHSAPRIPIPQQEFSGVGKLLWGEAGTGQILEGKCYSFENCKGQFNNCPAEVSRGPDPALTNMPQALL